VLVIEVAKASPPTPLLLLLLLLLLLGACAGGAATCALLLLAVVLVIALISSFFVGNKISPPDLASGMCDTPLKELRSRAMRPWLFLTGLRETITVESLGTISMSST